MSGLTDIPTFMSLTYVGYRVLENTLKLLGDIYSKINNLNWHQLDLPICAANSMGEKSRYTGKANRYGRDTFNT